MARRPLTSSDVWPLPKSGELWRIGPLKSQLYQVVEDLSVTLPSNYAVLKVRDVTCPTMRPMALPLSMFSAKVGSVREGTAPIPQHLPWAEPLLKGE